MSFSGRYAYDQTAALSFPRLVGSEGEVRAREYIVNEMKRLGLEVEEEEFSASSFPTAVLARVIMLILSAPIALSAFLYYLGRPAGALVVVTGGILFGVIALKKLTRSFESFVKFGKTSPSKNITGRQGTKGFGNVVMMAHYDTKSQPFPVELRIIIYLMSGIGIFGGGLGVFILSLLDLLGVSVGGGGAIFTINVFALAISASLLFNSVNNYSDGALDNAAGVGVILGIAKAMRENPVEGLSFTYVATSAEELGLLGAEAWIKVHEKEFDRERTMFLNYDGPGAKSGPVIALLRFGIPVRDVAGYLGEFFREVVRERKVKNAGSLYLPFGASTDMIPAANAGFKVLNLGSLMRGVHTRKDRIDRISAESLELAGVIGLDVIKKFKDKIGGN
ncbi:MAG: M28 family peptidase [Deltaproteobacteria bacterium]|nr:MAG: M28 family peptidase [Deltaproteobacteria bacterium]